jgi:FixJ family two-component response regulator
MVTGQNKDEVMPKMQGGDIDFLIFKPFKLNQLYEAVRASFEIKHFTEVKTKSTEK